MASPNWGNWAAVPSSDQKEKEVAKGCKGREGCHLRSHSFLLAMKFCTNLFKEAAKMESKYLLGMLEVGFGLLLEWSPCDCCGGCRLLSCCEQDMFICMGRSKPSHNVLQATGMFW